MKTILCIDSSEDLPALSGALEQAGYRVLEAEDSRQALRVFLNHRVDGVLMRQRCCSGFENHAMQQQIRRLDPIVPVLVFDGPPEAAQSALDWMEPFIVEARAAHTNG